MGHTPGRESREQSSERKTVVWGKVSKDWKVARNQKIKSGRAGSLDSKDTAVQGPWRKKVESEAGGIPGSSEFDGRTKLRAGLRMLSLGGRKQESGQGSSGS